MIRHYRGIDAFLTLSLIASGSIPDQAAPALAASTVALVSELMAANLPESNSVGSHHAVDEQISRASEGNAYTLDQNFDPNHKSTPPGLKGSVNLNQNPEVPPGSPI